MALVYQQSGNPGGAIRHYEKALELRPQETGILKLMADVYIHKLGGKIDIPFPIGIPKINPFSMIDGDRVYFRLYGPGEEGILFAQLSYFIRSHFI